MIRRILSAKSPKLVYLDGNIYALFSYINLNNSYRDAQVKPQPHKFLDLIPDLARKIILLLGFGCDRINDLSAQELTEGDRILTFRDFVQPSPLGEPKAIARRSRQDGVICISRNILAHSCSAIIIGL